MLFERPHFTEYVIRITSYNVCYTKLLRDSKKTKEFKQIERKTWQLKNGASAALDRLAENELESGHIVITSYSIHYTKLYEE